MAGTKTPGKIYSMDKVAIRMVKEPPLYSTEPIRTPEDAVRVINNFLKDYDREVFCVVALDTRMRPININIASMGNSTLQSYIPEKS